MSTANDEIFDEIERDSGGRAPFDVVVELIRQGRQADEGHFESI